MDEGQIRCPMFFAIVQTLLLRAESEVRLEDIARGLQFAATVPPHIAGVRHREGEAAHEFAVWVIGGLDPASVYKPSWWRD